MTITKHNIRRSAAFAAATLAALALQCSVAGPLALVDAPLFLGSAVKPNLIMAMDDSGSMDFEVLLPTGDGAAWWLTGASGSCNSNSYYNTFTGCARNSTATNDVPAAGALNFNFSGSQSSTWIKYAYLFPNGCDSSNTSYQRRSCDGTVDHFAIPPLAAYAFFRSPDYNPQYFNPNITYSPWVNGGGYTFSNATPTAARFDPVFGTAANALDLTKDVAGSTVGIAPITTATASVTGYDTSTCTDSAISTSAPASNYTFRIYTGMTLPKGTCFYASSHWQVVATTTGCQVASSCKVNVNGSATQTSVTLANASSVAIRYYPATFYVKTAMPAGYNYTGTKLAGVAPDGTALIGYEIKLANFSDAASYASALQNFANWFSYNRKRHQALRSGLGQAFNPMTGLRISGFRMNNLSTSITMGDIDNSTDRSTLYQNFYYNWIASGGTPTQHTINTLIANFKRSDSTAPVQYACQKNFGFLFTDGYANDPNSYTSTGNTDGTTPAPIGGPPYADNTPNTIADMVMGAYQGPLRSGTSFPKGMVPTPKSCTDGTAAASVDCNKDLHMNFYTVTLGTKGVAYDPDASPAQDPYANQPAWPSTLTAYNPVMVDDLWHATLNGRGLLLNAKSASDIATKLAAVLQDIIDKTGSASSAAVNSGSISSDTRVFQAQFNPNQWSGDVVSNRLQSDGTLSGAGKWTASTVVLDPNRRTIFTTTSGGSAVPFRWTSFSSDTTRQAQLRQTDTDAIAQSRVNYLRGDRSQELQNKPNGDKLRNRSSFLGDIINSAPLFVGAPPFRYPTSMESVPYSTFKAAQTDRTQAVYVGANDGMLHAFRADNGQELFAFIPGAVFSNLYRLTQPSYSHRYFVDGTPTMGDVFYSGAWHTVLATGLNGGGQSVFALEVTKPDAYAEGGATPFLWEFTDAQDADLGDTFARPSIVRMHNGHWAAIFGNGYNNTAPDNYVSATGNAVMYIVDISTGALLKKIDTGVGFRQDPTGQNRPNGLATVAAVDIDNDGTVDYAYAGDLFGNLWKFNLTDSTPANWVVAYTSGGAATPLFVATDSNNNRQPITTKPSVSRGPNGTGMVVLFGTGKYLEANDVILANLKPQSFYGIIDKNTGGPSDTVSGRSLLTQQKITLEQKNVQFGDNLFNIRLTTNNTIGSTRGWYIDLVSSNGFQGEMQITDSIIREKSVIFTTLIPSTDPCSAGGNSWLMALNLFTGAFLDQSAFDLNGDGKFDSGDTLNGQVVSGIQPTGGGILPKPASVATDDGNKGGTCPGDYLIMPNTNGGTEILCRNAGPRAVGRQSWRQIR